MPHTKALTCLSKPINDYGLLLKPVAEASAKIEVWHETLEELVQRGQSLTL